MTQPTLNLSWQELHHDCRQLANTLLAHPDKGKWQGIVGIARGGLIPAAILAREMDIRLVDTLCISSYEPGQEPTDGSEKQGELNVLKAIDHDGAGLLVVDDLVDSGNTARVARQLLPEATLATLYAKPAARQLVDYYVREVGQATWIHFPWDLDPEQNFVEPMANNSA